MHLLGITGVEPRFFSQPRNASLSLALLANTCLAALNPDHKGMAAVQSAPFPGAKKLKGRPFSSLTAWSLVVRPPRLLPMACAPPPVLPAAERWALMIVLSMLFS